VAATAPPRRRRGRARQQQHRQRSWQRRRTGCNVGIRRSTWRRFLIVPPRFGAFLLGQRRRLACLVLAAAFWDSVRLEHSTSTSTWDDASSSRKEGFLPLPLPASAAKAVRPPSLPFSSIHHKSRRGEGTCGGGLKAHIRMPMKISEDRTEKHRDILLPKFRSQKSLLHAR
jgi:hypothetical protein